MIKYKEIYNNIQSLQPKHSKDNIYIPFKNDNPFGNHEKFLCKGFDFGVELFERILDKIKENRFFQLKVIVYKEMKE